MDPTHRRQDKADVPAAGPSALTDCLHVVFCAAQRRPVEVRLRRLCHFLVYFQWLRAPSPARSELRRSYASASLSTLRHDDRISPLAGRVSTSNRRLMAHDEDDFRIRPGKVRDHGGRLDRAPHRRARPSDQLHRRGASGDPARWRQPLSTDGDREGRRPVQRARPGHCGGADAQGPERVEPGRERCAHAVAAGGGEGSRREAQPAARRRARTAVRQRQGGGRASALSRTRRGDARRREGTGLFGRARRGGRPRLSSNGVERIATSSASSSRPRTGWSCPTCARPPAI